MGRQAYLIPDTLEEAVGLLATHAGAARVVGGGTDFFVSETHHSVPVLVDVTRLRGLNDIRREGDDIVIGCGVTHSQIVASPLIQRHGTALGEACGQIGGPQVRHVGTLAGNIAHALPAADGTLALLALDGEVLVAEAGPERLCTSWWPLSQAFKGPGQSAIDSSRQVLAAMRFRATGRRQASCFARVMRPQGVALPIVGLAVRVALHDDHTLADAIVALGPAGPTPFRARECEAHLRGLPLNERTLNHAAEVLLREVQLRTSPHRATAEYRRQLVPVLLRRALTQAVERAKAATE